MHEENVSMAQIARYTGVSQSTVSIIANGMEKERHISDATVEKVRAAMRELGYKPNLNARRLRTKKQHTIIAFFWPISRRSSILASFLKGMQEEIKKQNYDCELMVQNFENNRLYKLSDNITKSNYSGIIFGATSVADIEFLESLDCMAPIALFNRDSEKYSTVQVDNSQIANLAVDTLRRDGAKDVALFIPASPYLAAEQRIKRFVEMCAEAEIGIQPAHVFHAEDDLAGGAEAARRFLQLKDRPRYIFCESDQLALGALHAFYKAGIKIPEDIKIFATGLMNPSFAEYSNPSLTTIDMRTVKLASAITACLLKQIRSPMLSPEHVVLEAELVYRDSFPAPKG